MLTQISTPAPFEPAEFTTRCDMLQAELQARDIDALAVTTPENLYYLTGYSTPAYYSTQMLVVPADGPTLLLAYVADVDIAAELPSVEDAVSYGPTDAPLSVLARALAARGLTSGRIAVELDSPFFSIRRHQELHAALPAATLVDGSGMVERQRMIKSSAEIAHARAAAAIASAAMQEVQDAITVGGTENDVAAAAYAGAIRNGGEYPGSPPYVSSGPRVMHAHVSWDRRVIEPGDQVYVELCGCIRRYGAALMRTFCLGAPCAELRRLEGAVVAGLEAAIAALRPGVSSGEVDAACRAPLREEGFAFDHETGYSIGVNYPPGWNETHVFNLKPGDERLVQENMVLHLVPNVAVPGVGVCGVSETVLVTADGAEILTAFPRGLIAL